MPVEFLTDEQAAAYGRFVGVPSRAELEQYFVLDDGDWELIEPKRRLHNRLGFAALLTSVRYLGVFPIKRDDRGAGDSTSVDELYHVKRRHRDPVPGLVVGIGDSDETSSGRYAAV